MDVHHITERTKKKPHTKTPQSEILTDSEWPVTSLSRQSVNTVSCVLQNFSEVRRWIKRTLQAWSRRVIVVITLFFFDRCFRSAGVRQCRRERGAQLTCWSSRTQWCGAEWHRGSRHPADQRWHVEQQLRPPVQPLGPGAEGLVTALTPAGRQQLVKEPLDGSSSSATVENISSVEVSVLLLNLRHIISYTVSTF